MFRRFGSEVSIIETTSALLPHEDSDISDCIRDILHGEGVNLLLGAECIELSNRRDQIEAKINGIDTSIKGTHVLMATGRRPNTDT